MRFTPLDITGAWLIEIEPVNDDRGYFARWYDDDLFVAYGLEQVHIQGAVSHNRERATLRGLHVIPENIGEAKLVRCIRGAVFDVMVDLRPQSRTFRKWLGLELSARTYAALYFPRGCAHGFITLEDECDIAYAFSEPYRPGVELGLRWNDPDIAIDWPLAPQILSERDARLPYLNDLLNSLS